MKKRKRNPDEYFNNEIAPHYHEIHRHLIKLGCEEYLALDMAQETMATAWKHIYEVMDMDYPVSWLYTVAQNNYFSYARRLFLNYEYPDTDFIYSDIELCEYEYDIADLIIANESSEIVEKAFSMIDVKYSHLLRMRIFGEYTYEEMSEILGMNSSTIRSAVRRGKLKMAEILNESGYFKEEV